MVFLSCAVAGEPCFRMTAVYLTESGILAHYYDCNKLYQAFLIIIITVDITIDLSCTLLICHLIFWFIDEPFES